MYEAAAVAFAKNAEASAREAAFGADAAAIKEQVARQDALAADIEDAMDDFAIEGLTDGQIALIAAHVIAKGWKKA
jgi:hypothetical protein